MDKNYDRIFIKDLTLEMFIGIFPDERKNKQRVIINIVMDVTHKTSVVSIDDVVSYKDIAEGVEKICISKHYDLVETLCEDIADMCLRDTRVDGVSVRAEKPDILPNCKSVGVEIVRCRK